MNFSDVLRGHTFLTDEQVAEIWREAVFCLDTNVLLNVYRYGEKGREEFLRILAAIKDRLFVPHRVADEFARNRIGAIRDHHKPIRELVAIFDSAKEHVESMSDDHPRRDSLAQLVDEAKQLVSSRLSQDTQSADDLVTNDTVLSHLLEVIGETIGEPCKSELLKTEYTRRKTELVPPFCKVDDKEKDSEERRTGDVAIWLELLDEFSKLKKPLIFVTDDNKENWWAEYGGRKYAQPKLVKEMFERSGCYSLFYSSERFGEAAPLRLSIGVRTSFVEETKAIVAARKEELLSLATEYKTLVDSMQGEEERKLRRIAIYVMKKVTGKSTDEISMMFTLFAHRTGIPKVQMYAEITELRNVTRSREELRRSVRDIWGAHGFDITKPLAEM